MSIANVTHAEANLLTLARCVVSSGPSPELTRLLLVSVVPPSKLGPTSTSLLQDTLARGVAFQLLVEGGWTKEVDGRLWDRELPALRFTANVLRLLIWALRLPLAEPEVAPLQFEGELTPSEQVFAALFVERARGTAAEHTVMRQMALRRQPLVQLVHAAAMGRHGPLTVSAVTAHELPFVRGVLDLLGDAWLSAELFKPQLAQPKALANVGRAQTAVAAAFLDVVDAQRQRHLARFFIDAAAAWLSVRSSSAELVSLDPESPMRERGEARQQAAALWRVIQRLEQWDQQHRATRFIDDDYERAQGMVRDWERLGPNGFGAAHRLVSELDALPT
jgi:hypothetical protein